MQDIAIVGAGAIGCRIAAHLAQRGTLCMLFDGWADHVEAVRSDGLLFDFGGSVSRHRLAMHHYDDTMPEHGFDLVLLAVRSNDTQRMLPLVQRLLRPHGCVVSCQNGINEDEIAAVVGAARTLGCSMVLGARLLAPGQVQAITGADTLRIGALVPASASSHVDEVVRLLSACGSASATTNLMGYRWTKLTLNCIGNPLLLLSGLTGAQLHARQAARELMIGLAREVIASARRSGFAPEPVLDVSADDWLSDDPQVLSRLHRALIEHGERLGPRRLSMTADFEARGQTEIDHINGYVVRKAREAGSCAPLNALVVAAVHRMEAAGRGTRGSEQQLATLLDQATLAEA